MTTTNTTSGRLIIMSGIPGSGKSTKAKQILADLRANGEKAVIVNRDDLRTTLFGEDYHKSAPVPEAEDDVTSFQHSLISNSLRRGFVVISDDTNLSPYTLKKLNKIAKDYGAVVEELPVIVPLEVAIERNRLRGASGGRFVPEEVIKSMFKNQLKALKAKGLL